MGPSPDHRVRDSYRACRRMQLRHDPTYFVATRALPAARRPAVHALYGFVRGADEIADSRCRAGDGDRRRAALDTWQAELEAGLARGWCEHPVIAALVDAGPRHGLPLHLVGDYMDAMRSDCREPVRMRDQAELEHYMDGTATVGALVAPLLGAPNDAGGALSRLGVAFQLTNFIRDVPHDWGLDRIYLPGLHEHDLAQGHATHRLREHVALQVARARELFRDSEALALALPGAVRPGVRIARAVYLRVLDRVERLDYDVVGRRAALSPWEAAAGAFGGALAR